MTTSSSVRTPASIAWCSSPKLAACLRSSTATTPARARTSGASSCLVGSSEPTAVTCVPASSQSASTSGTVDGVVVMTMPAPRTASCTESQSRAESPKARDLLDEGARTLRRARCDTHAIDGSHLEQRLELVAGLASCADDRRRGDVVTGQEVGRDRSCGTRPELGQKAVVAEHADEGAVDRADDQHQPAVPRGAAVARVEVGGYLHGPHPVVVKVAGFDVRDAFRSPKGERDDARERRLTSMKRTKRAFDRRAGRLEHRRGRESRTR